MKAFILRHDSQLSHEYSEIASESCDAVKLEWEYFDGFSNMLGSDAQKQLGIIANPKKTKRSVNSAENKAQLCTAGHMGIWKHIVDNDVEEAVILEHDAVMLQKPDFKFPDDAVIALGYKLHDINRYAHQEQKSELRKIDRHSGSHAYALSKRAAQQLLDGISKSGSAGCIDQHMFRANRFRNNLNLYISDPICAIGWIRKSTIWNESSNHNFEYVDSFREKLS